MVEQLIKLNFNLNSKGFNYWIKAIELYKKNNGKIKTCELYKELAKIFDTTSTAIERDMRHARINSNINKLYDYDIPFTNTSVLRFLYLKEEK